MLYINNTIKPPSNLPPFHSVIIDNSLIKINYTTMKAIWNGAIGFGLVNIPVKMYSATESSAIDLDMLDKNDHENIRFKRVNEKSGKEVLWENIVKGYKLNDEYIVLDDEDFEAASPE